MTCGPKSHMKRWLLPDTSTFNSGGAKKRSINLMASHCILALWSWSQVNSSSVKFPAPKLGFQNSNRRIFKMNGCVIVYVAVDDCGHELFT